MNVGIGVLLFVLGLLVGGVAAVFGVAVAIGSSMDKDLED